MNIIQTAIPDVLIVEPKVFSDARGFFYESYNKKTMQAAGITGDFVQDNHSRSARNVLRGLHYQITQPQGKLVRAVAGEIFDVAVDVRRNSPTFGQWVGMNLSAENRRMAWIPPGFAHGFLVLSEFAEVLYKTTDYWAPQSERTIVWNDRDLAIAWPTGAELQLSAKDKAGMAFNEAEIFE
ncbi:MAG: dTDP-4-dehydrorhamnose 3,5-epimerase [Sulfuricaulis sp.]|uniref:dTDP-4-dehydrorhamnose 3,5-epimerase n=1 Tax=Sulfuricaulis sp. TaxID=2003553 RepID=UPI0025E3145A|nr:dTDP-4-dehydrorhamnose 3,5-epimerase [Sulfuricaulis sp.]MCR4347330.1 dTDP-4-dehydrorhamnose 3,5-epimerase [Sulfuricaulis sp.]